MKAKPKEAKPTGEPGWAWRRAVIFPNIAISFWLLDKITGLPSSPVNETIAWGLIVNIICSVMFYAGFAAAQDIAAIFATRSGLPYSPQSSPAEATPGTESPKEE